MSWKSGYTDFDPGKWYIDDIKNLNTIPFNTVINLLYNDFNSIVPKSCQKNCIKITAIKKNRFLRKFSHYLVRCCRYFSIVIHEGSFWNIPTFSYMLSIFRKCVSILCIWWNRPLCGFSFIESLHLRSYFRRKKYLPVMLSNNSMIRGPRLRIFRYRFSQMTQRFLRAVCSLWLLFAGPSANGWSFRSYFVDSSPTLACFFPFFLGNTFGIT